jgi:hypothetical protein
MLRLKVGTIEILDAVLESLAVGARIIIAALLFGVAALYAGCSLLFASVPGMKKAGKALRRSALRSFGSAASSLACPFREGHTLCALVVYAAIGIQISWLLRGDSIPYVEYLGGGFVLFYVILRGLWATLRGRPRAFGFGFFASLFGLRNTFLSNAPNLARAYKNPIWTHTSRLNSMEIAELNDEFERITATALRSLGFDARATGAKVASKQHKGPGDGGVDVVLADGNGEKIVVSCKRYQKPVGVQEVRDIFAVSKCTDHIRSRAMLVTTVGFTAPAVLFAQKNEIIIATLDELIERAMRQDNSRNTNRVSMGAAS